ncbi:hypothetical protein DK871_07385 [Pseudomonas sp. L13]|nr:hypothetical protein [Pseudomonas sp. L13]
MLAKNVNDNACFLTERGVCEFFASKLAPTESGICFVVGQILYTTHVTIGAIFVCNLMYNAPKRNISRRPWRCL